ncbi:CD109 antigen-like isoform X2 [Lytechinus variegatus]|uniref:CD109 antigen-like isoform X2 n=1 Tax=Lytechinus variegatus TaxID=7654 RepID=UPI001BB2706A|nr:CD109 antigen-like isoform X2 [Lytechinus variegatus]
MIMMQQGSVVLLLLYGMIAGIKAQPRPPPPMSTPAPVYPGRYIILAANTIRPGMPLVVSVSIFETEGNLPVNLQTSILRNGIAEVSSTDMLQTGTTQITLQIPVTASAVGEYSLSVLGTGGLMINQTESLHFNIDHFSIFVQSDKAIYKPGQTVHYRVLAVYPDLKPYTGPFTVTVSDGNGNAINQMIDKMPNKNGILSEEMVMSENPVLGDWVIKVEAEGQTKEYTFKIDEYVLPKFEVSIQAPTFFDPSDEVISVKYIAKYTFGKPVEGTLSVGVKLRYQPNSRQLQRRIQLSPNTVETEVNFKASELLDLKRQHLFDSQLSWYENEMLLFTANVTETLTGIMQQADEATVFYHSKPIKVVFQESISRSTFKPGLPYRVYLVVTRQDGSPLTEEERQRGLKLDVCRGNDCIQENLVIDQQAGVAETTISSSNKETSIQLWAEYRGVSQNRVSYGTQYDRRYNPVDLPAGSYMVTASKYLQRSNSPSNTYIQVSPDNPDALRIGSMASFNVQSTVVPGKLTYQIISRGNILVSETISGLTGSEYVIEKQITAEMSPKSKLIVYFLTDSGEVVLDSLEFVVNVVFHNPVSASFSKKMGEPGDRVSFDVETTPGAFVGVLAIDRSVQLLADGNDITHNQVLESVGRFDTTPDNSWGYNPFFDFAFCFIPYPTSGINAGEILRNAGIIYITDGNVVYVGRPWFRDHVPVFAAAGGFGNAGTADGNAESGVANRKNEVGPVPEKKVRKEFPETWLWVDTEADSAGRVSIDTTFPDTITSWVGTAISMDAINGLGVTHNASRATVFKDFFISLNLPYSVIRGEKFVLEANIFNYLKDNVTANVILAASPSYEILKDGQPVSTMVTKTVKVAANKSATAKFAVNPLKNGMIDLRVDASVPNMGVSDAVLRRLLVEPEGIEQEEVVSRLVDMSNVALYSQTFNISLPNDVVPDSIRAVLTATGDILGPTMANLDQLLRMPTGCGEQTMIAFAPDVFIYKYLRETGQSNPTIEQKALRFMEKGYQNELRYQHEDGSFSAFGQSNNANGSTWLTAFVVRSFLQAESYIFIDRQVIERAITFLIAHTNADGSFQKSGRIIDHGIEGGVSSVQTLTAYCAITMKQVLISDIVSDSTKRNAQTKLSAAVGFLERSYNGIQDDKYAMAIVTYALAQGGSMNTQTFLNRLNALQTVEDDGRLKYWTDQDEQSTPANDEYYYWWRGPPSTAVEMTGYGLLTYLTLNDVTGSIPIAAWLSQQRNSLGGYSSTQDTVIALLALTSYAEVVAGGNKNMMLSISTTADPTYSQDFTITNENAIILQQFELPVDSGSIKVEGTGEGSFLLSLILHYNLYEVRTSDVFQTTITVLSSDTDSVELEACARYTGNEGTGMAIMDIGIPSGFYAEENRLQNAIDEVASATKYEISGQSVIIYLDEIFADSTTCITAHARRSEVVAETKPSMYQVYRYYAPAQRSVQSYSVDALSNTDICQLCRDCCYDDSGAVPSATTPTVLLLVLTFTTVIGALLM